VMRTSPESDLTSDRPASWYGAEARRQPPPGSLGSPGRKAGRLKTRHQIPAISSVCGSAYVARASGRQHGRNQQHDVATDVESDQEDRENRGGQSNQAADDLIGRMRSLDHGGQLSKVVVPGSGRPPR